MRRYDLGCMNYLKVVQRTTWQDVSKPCPHLRCVRFSPLSLSLILESCWLFRKRCKHLHHTENTPIVDRLFFCYPQCGSQPPNQPLTIPTFWYSHPSYILPGLACVAKRIWRKGWYRFWDEVIKRLQFPYWVHTISCSSLPLSFSLFLSLTFLHLTLGKAHCHFISSPLERSMWWGIRAFYQ